MSNRHPAEVSELRAAEELAKLRAREPTEPRHPWTKVNRLEMAVGGLIGLAFFALMIALLVG
jgi:hypothetical protein